MEDIEKKDKWYKNPKTGYIVELIAVDEAGGMVEVDFGIGLPYLFGKDEFFRDFKPVPEGTPAGIEKE